MSASTARSADLTTMRPCIGGAWRTHPTASRVERPTTGGRSSVGRWTLDRAPRRDPPLRMPDSPVRSAVVLADGTVVDIEPMRSTDGARLDQFHHTLSGETIQFRFFSVHPELSDQELHRF